MSIDNRLTIIQHLILFLIHFGTCAIGTDYVVSILDESFSDHRNFALMTKEALVVPSLSFKSNKFSAPKTSFSCYGLDASNATFGEELCKTIGTIWKIIPGSESLSGQGFGAICTCETFAVIGFISVSYTSTSYDLLAFDTFCCKFVLIASSAVNVIFLGDE